MFRRGSLLSAAIFVYAASSPVNGFAGGSMYARFGGTNWIKQVSERVIMGGGKGSSANLMHLTIQPVCWKFR